jgi:putative tricarboxylic transport membrane protein
MRDRRRWNIDQATGLIFIAVGAAFLIAAQQLPLGTPRRMGPGWFPSAIAAALVIVGIALTLKDAFGPGAPHLPDFAWRKLAIVLAALLAFTVLLNGAGMIIATAALVTVASLARPTISPPRAALYGLGLGIFCSIVFVRLLAIPVPAIGPWLGF